MLSTLLNHPPPTHDLRPEKTDYRPTALEGAVRAVTGPVERFVRTQIAGLEKIVPLVEQHAARLEGASDAQLREEASRLGFELRRGGFRPDLVGTVFAVVREVAGRTVGKRHYDVQLMGGWALLKGMIAEMETGEGKTLTATLAATTAALAGVPVHVLTVNDYLTARDAEEMGPVYRALGLSVGCVTHEVPVENRRAQYLNDITYCTNKDIVFDYLRDRLTLGELGGAPLRLRAESLYAREAREKRLLLRGLYYAITDEADSLLIDESRTPLIISGSVVGREEIQFMEAALAFAGGLAIDTDFLIDNNTRQIRITEKGEKRINALVLPPETPWTSTIRKHEMIRRAISALHLFHLDKEYLVRDGKVQIIDVFTGRVMPDRSWEQGLQQLIEIKEGCEVTKQQETVARISYQKFFRRYLHLAGMTGTAKEVTGEFWSVYGLPVVRIRTHRPLRRHYLAGRIFTTMAQKEQHLLERVRVIHGTGQPILIGTGSVAASEKVSGLLSGAGLPHTVLNAKNDHEEAQIVALAGERGAITIATNMAGRGTDIKLAPGVTELNGLHVILTERHEAARIDRQLAGRCARQGDPGSFEAILSLDDALLENGRGGIPEWVARRFALPGSNLWNIMANYAIMHAQKKMERFHGRMRRDLFKNDVQTKKIMSFARGEE
ncbi:MAG: prepilin peptidase [Geobacter sp.]|nr:MAG: prepilin peptidase [Geobacter sp.]